MKPSDFLLYARKRLLPLLCMFLLCLSFGSIVFADPISFAAGIAGAGMFPMLPVGMTSQNFVEPLDITTDWSSSDVTINIQNNARVDERGSWSEVTISGDYLDSLKDAIDSFVGSYQIQAHIDMTLYETAANWDGIYFTEQFDTNHFVYVLPVSYVGQTGSLKDLSWQTRRSGSSNVKYTFTSPTETKTSGFFNESLLPTYRIVLYYSSDITQGRNVQMGNFAGDPLAVYNKVYSEIIASSDSEDIDLSVGDILDVSDAESLTFLVLYDDIPESGTYTGSDALDILDDISSIPFDDTDDHEWLGDIPPVPPTPPPTSDTIADAPVADLWDHFGDVTDNQEDIIEGLNDIPPLIDDTNDALNDININIQEGNQSLDDLSDTLDDISDSVEDSQGILQDIADAIDQGVSDIVSSLQGVLDGILTAIEEGPVQLFRTALGAIKTVFGSLLIRLSGILGIWHYVVEWFNSISVPFAFFRNSANSISYYLILPVYACIAGGIVIAVYKRFGR